MNNDDDIASRVIKSENENCDYYRRILASASRLETLQSNLDSVIDYFLTPLVKLYTRLRNDSLKLLFECDFRLDQFRKVEELLWRRIYHDVYRFQRQIKIQKRQQLKKQDQNLLESHFISGIGFYSTLIVKLRYRYKIYNVRGTVEPLAQSLDSIENYFLNDPCATDHNCCGQPNFETDYGRKLFMNDHNYSSKNDSMMMIDLDGKVDTDLIATKEWASQAIYRSLVYMGDLARYLLETSQFDYRKLAYEFYLSASRNQPDFGLPFNQLATLASNSNDNLDAVCNYMRCCLKPKPFEGAEGNMRKLFDLNNKLYEELIESDCQITKASQVLSSKNPSEAAQSMISSIIITFIKLASDLWMAAATSVNESNFVQEDRVVVEFDTILARTHLFFENLREALELEPIVPLAMSFGEDMAFETSNQFCPISDGSSNSERQKYLTPTIMYEFCSIAIMLLTKCQIIGQIAIKRNVNGDEKSSTSVCLIDLVNTLTLNLLHYSTAKCQKMIMSKLQELRVARLEIDSTTTKITMNNQKQNSKLDYGDSSQKIFKNSQSISAAIGQQSELLATMTNNQNRGETFNHQQTNQFVAINDTSKRVLSRLRQRRAATNYSDSLQATNNINTAKLKQQQAPIASNFNNQLNEDSDMSELEETALSTIDALDISSEISSSNEGGRDYQITDLIDLNSSSDEISSSRMPDKKNKKFFTSMGMGSSNSLNKPILRPTRSQNYEDESRYNCSSNDAPNSLPMPDLLTGDTHLSSTASARLNLIESGSLVKRKRMLQLSAPGIGAKNSEDDQKFSDDNEEAEEEEQNDFERAMHHVYSQTYLPTIKILCDWLLSNGQVINNNLQSFCSFQNEFEELVNYLKDLRKLADMRDFTAAKANRDSNSSCEMLDELGCQQHVVYTHIFDGPAWIQKYPLSCDYPMYNLLPLKTVHELNIDFNYHKDLNESESGFITIQCIEAFFYALTAFLKNKRADNFK